MSARRFSLPRTTATATVPAAEDFTPEREEPGASRPDPLEPPHPVRLGAVLTGGLAPAIMAIVERGVRRRPGPARSLRAEVELTMDEGYPPVRIVFAEDSVLVEDGPAVQPDVRIGGALPDLIGLMTSPAIGGVPVPVNARGRAALGMVVNGRVRLQGSKSLVRRLLTVIRL